VHAHDGQRATASSAASMPPSPQDDRISASRSKKVACGHEACSCRRCPPPPTYAFWMSGSTNARFT
jgi:hypothetical protein